MLLSSIPLCFVYHIFFISSSVDGCLGCFQVLTIVNNAAVNFGVHASFQTSVLGFFGYIQRSEIAESYGNSLFNFLRNFHVVSMVDVSIYIPTKSGTRQQELSFLYFLTSICYLCSFFWSSFWWVWEDNIWICICSTLSIIDRTAKSRFSDIHG